MRCHGLTCRTSVWKAARKSISCESGSPSACDSGSVQSLRASSYYFPSYHFGMIFSVRLSTEFIGIEDVADTAGVRAISVVNILARVVKLSEAAAEVFGSNRLL